MFSVTPMTAVNGDDIPLSDEDESSLIGNISWYLYGEGVAAEWQLREGLQSRFLPVEFVNKEGKLAKRISKWVKDVHAYDLDSGQLEKVGGIIASYRTGQFWYDITARFNWVAGDFGDKGSCFWYSRSEARDMMQDSGGLAIRFYDSNGNGNGRAWVMPYGDDWVFFNAYGPSLDTITNRVQAIFPEAKLRKVSLENWGSTTETLWINDDVGVLVSERERKISQVDLELGDDESNCCEHCSDHFSGEAYWAGEICLCESCYDRHYDQCEHCQRTIHNDYLYTIEYKYRRGNVWFQGANTLCESCREDYSSCEECGYEICALDHHMTEIGHDYVCPDCLKQNYDKCECGEYIKKGESCDCQAENEQENEDVEEEEREMVPMITTLGNPYQVMPENVAFFQEIGWRVAA